MPKEIKLEELSCKGKYDCGNRFCILVCKHRRQCGKK
jgi:hypothetical protein